MATASVPLTLAYDIAGQILYPVDNGEPLSNDTEHLRWITFLRDGIEDWFTDQGVDAFVAADLLWYPVEGDPTTCKAPDVMVVLSHPPGERRSYLQWKENNRGPQVVFEFASTSNTASEMMEKLEFYDQFGCDEFFIYDYQRGTIQAFARNGSHLARKQPEEGVWKSALLGMTFGMNKQGKLWVKLPDGSLMQNRRQILHRAKVAERLIEQERQRALAAEQKAAELAAKLKALGIDP